MSTDIIQARLAREKVLTAAHEQQVLREILQEVALSGLARAGLFRVGAFHGGSSLRILHALRRFSEDLDFVLLAPDPTFSWRHFGKALLDELSLYGIECEIRDRDEVKAVRSLFLKDQSLGKILQLRYPLRVGQKLTVKLEIDTNPPAGSTFETRYVDFPVPFSLVAQDLSSGFANKLHALLCREYVKGRDWFDFLWYVQGRIAPRWELLASALDQQGPWRGTQTEVCTDWLVQALRQKVASIEWAEARDDVERFLEEPERRGLEVWSASFFASRVEMLGSYLKIGAG